MISEVSVHHDGESMVEQSKSYGDQEERRRGGGKEGEKREGGRE
jgi:hypothetical protein